MHIGIWWERFNEIHHFEDVDVDGRIILRWILEKYNGVVWTGGFICLKIGTSGGLL
jgi:hypothetical protein